MAEAQIRDDVGVRNKGIAIEVTQGRGLDRTTEEKRKFLQGIGQIGDDHFTDVAAGSAVQDEAESAFGIVLADQQNGALEERTLQLAAIEQQLSFEECLGVRHTAVKSHLNEIWMNFLQCQNIELAGRGEVYISIPAGATIRQTSSRGRNDSVERQSEGFGNPDREASGVQTGGRAIQQTGSLRYWDPCHA